MVLMLVSPVFEAVARKDSREKVMMIVIVGAEKQKQRKGQSPGFTKISTRHGNAAAAAPHKNFWFLLHFPLKKSSPGDFLRSNKQACFARLTSLYLSTKPLSTAASQTVVHAFTLDLKK